jgi:predicted phosphodiesterase
MKFGILSDLHMEFAPWYFEPEPDVFYLNAGDTHPHKLQRDYFNSLFDGKIFSVMGNHDYYGDYFDDYRPESIRIGDFSIAGATLWTDIKPDRWFAYQGSLVDYSLIRGMTYEKYVAAHEKHKEYLFASGADIWVVHHLPSFASVHDKYLTSPANDFFATELGYRIQSMTKPPKLIVHGHTHDACDYMIGNTRVICHPRGYPNETPLFKNYMPKVIEL